MEKLEKILRAEDAARTRVSSARDEAAGILADAMARVAEIHATAEAAAIAEAEDLAASIVQAAATEAAEFTAASSRSLERMLHEAETRMESAIAAVLAELTE